ncbi:unnamed protein product [Rotaria sordida]|uniref:DUF3533 domain-containing protein n=2 Tax=Rotaria sordida TaxID=392033 RepID=A0A819B8X0_9BILA|nr:unnamed protein product [Rotaria sordida]
MCTFYLGSGRNPSQYTGNLKVAIVDFDGGQAGSFFLDAFRTTPPGNLTLHWQYKDPNDYGNSVDNTQQAVDDGQVWAIVVLRPNITSTINKSLSALINSTTLVTYPFVNTLPVLVTYDEGRSPFTQNAFVLRPIRAAIATANNRYSRALRASISSILSSTASSNTNRTLQRQNSLRLKRLLASPFVVQYNNLHPALPFVGQLATTNGYIYLFLVTTIVVGSVIGTCLLF